MDEVSSTLHEIRTPLQTILGTLELLGDTKLDKEQKEYLHQIEFSAKVMLGITNNVLDFSKIQSNSLKIEDIPFNLTETAENITDLVSLECFAKKVELVTDIEPSLDFLIRGDPVRLQQIILNLLKNAVKFTASGYVALSIKTEQDSLLIEVKDSGIGMTDGQKQKLFTDFYQADSSTARLYGGSGLGLSISKKLVTLMKGTIGVKDNTPNGSVFFIKLPLTQAEKIHTETVAVPPDTRVLIVDDSNEASSSLEKKLRYIGINEVNHVSSGEKALEELDEGIKEKRPYTLAFLDLEMEKIDGWHLASLINSRKEVNGIKLILMIPEGRLRKDAKMKMLGWFNAYLYKPLKLRLLKEALDTVFDTPLDLEAIDEENAEPLTPLTQAKEAEPLEKSGQIKVLVVEDHPVNIKLMTRFVEKTGALCLNASTATDAIQAVKDNPDTAIVFMDIGLPDMGGDEASRELRRMLFKGTIIACTANNDEDEKEHYRECGMDDFVTKPIGSAAITELIERYSPAGK